MIREYIKKPLAGKNLLFGKLVKGGRGPREPQGRRHVLDIEEPQKSYDGSKLPLLTAE